MVNPKENESPSGPGSKTTPGPNPARRSRIPPPSSSIQQSSTPRPAGGRASVETPRGWFITTKSYSPKDNSFPTAGVYLKEHRLCSFHLWDLRLPAFYLGSLQPPFGSALPSAAFIK